MDPTAATRELVDFDLDHFKAKFHQLAVEAAIARRSDDPGTAKAEEIGAEPAHFLMRHVNQFDAQLGYPVEKTVFENLSARHGCAGRYHGELRVQVEIFRVEAGIDCPPAACFEYAAKRPRAGLIGPVARI